MCHDGYTHTRTRAQWASAAASRYSAAARQRPVFVQDRLADALALVEPPPAAQRVEGGVLGGRVGRPSRRGRRLALALALVLALVLARARPLAVCYCIVVGLVAAGVESRSRSEICELVQPTSSSATLRAPRGKLGVFQ